VKRVTVLDVARRAGVSQGSVSRVLTGKNWVSDDVRARVEEAARALGYVPNAMAQGLKARRTNTVAALVSDMSNPLHGEFLAAAEEVLGAAGYLLLVASSHGRTDRELALVSAFGSGRVDGLLVAHSDETDAATTGALQATGLPLVFHDRESGELGDAVVADHQAGAYAATRHLLDLGHVRIAVLTPPAVVRPGRERLVGHARALAEAGIAHDPQLVRSLGASSDLSFSEVKGLLALKQPPTAVICLGTRMLAGVLTAVDSAGLRIPDDLSLVGIGDTDLLRLHAPPITSVRWDIAHCGRLAASLLLERLGAAQDAQLGPRIRHVPVELVLRQSTAPPPKRPKSKR
jgi:LacI family transcriptional regulator